MEKIDQIGKVVEGKTSIEVGFFTFLTLFCLGILVAGLVLFLIIFIVKMIKTKENTTKGKKRINEISKLDTYIGLYFSRLKGYKKYIFLTKHSALLFSTYGIYYIYETNEVGLLEGSYKEQWLKKRGSTIPILNPFYQMRVDYRQINFIKERYQKIMIIPNTCHFSVVDYEDEKIVKEMNIMTEMDALMGNIEVYTKEQIQALYESCNVNLCQKKRNDLPRE